MCTLNDRKLSWYQISWIPHPRGFSACAKDHSRSALSRIHHHVLIRITSVLVLVLILLQVFFFVCHLPLWPSEYVWDVPTFNFWFLPRLGETVRSLETVCLPVTKNTDLRGSASQVSRCSPYADSNYSCSRGLFLYLSSWRDLATTLICLQVQSIASLISIKLDRENYLLWKSQFLPILRANKLLK